jgi:hypothetical protein
MSTLTVIVGYCGSGKSTLLDETRRQRADAEFMDEGFLSPGNDRDYAKRAAILKALDVGRDCFVTLFDCLAVDNRRLLERQMREHAPGATIAWWFFADDVEKANRNCVRDRTRERDIAGNVAQNLRAQPFYTIPSTARIMPIVELPA